MSKDGLNKKQLIISSGMAIISFLITVFIGFWTSPFIVSKLGAVAYGFSTLGGNFTTYMSLITVAINSFAARYITIALQKNDTELASKYFTSVFIANVVMAVIMLIPITTIIALIDKIFSIPEELVLDVRVQWGILFGSWIIELLFRVYSTSTFAKNRLDIDHGLTAVSNVIRLAVIVVLFNVFEPRLWYIGVAALACTIFIDVGFVIYKRKLMPEVLFNRRYFDFKCIRTLFIKGIWNSINELASLLMNGFDLVITNWVVNATSMGHYSIAQTLPTYLQSLMYTICGIFNPNLTMSYAQGRNDQVRDGLKFAMKFNSLLLMVPLMGFFVYGKDFYRLWQYSLDENTIRIIFILSTLVILPMISGILVQPLLTVNTVTAKLKVPVFVNIIIGISNIVIEIILVKTTNLGVYAIAGVSSALLLIRNYLFYPIYAARNLKLPAWTFYPTIIKGSIVTVIVFVFLYGTHMFLKINSWMSLIIYAVIFGIAAELLVFLTLLSSEERKSVKIQISQKLRKRG